MNSPDIVRTIRAWQTPEEPIPRVLLVDHTVVAAGVLRRNPLHPRPWHFRWIHNDGFVATDINDVLSSCINDPLVNMSDLVHIAVQENEHHVLAWAASRGFQPCMRTWLGRIPWRNLPESCGHAVEVFADADSPQLRRRLAAAHEYWYRVQHAWNPPKAISSAEAVGLFLDERELVPQFTWFVQDDVGEIMGFSSLRDVGDPQSFELGWLGTTMTAKPDIHACLLAAALAAARTNRRDLLVEIDETDMRTLEYLQTLDVNWEPILIRLETTVGVLAGTHQE